jgi:CRISPR type I-E-associated protein CasB/Cse2
MIETAEKFIHYYKLNDERKENLIDWWRGLHKRNGPRAELRRCALPEDAALHPDVFIIHRIAAFMSYEAAATIAGILSHVRVDNTNLNQPFAVTLGSSIDGRVKFSETRFKQLLSSRNWNEFYTRLRRCIKMFNGNVNPVSVADIILRWDEEQRYGSQKGYGHSLKFDLSNDYYSQIEKNENIK